MRVLTHNERSSRTLEGMALFVLGALVVIAVVQLDLSFILMLLGMAIWSVGFFLPYDTWQNTCEPVVEVVQSDGSVTRIDLLQRQLVVPYADQSGGKATVPMDRPTLELTRIRRVAKPFGTNTWCYLTLTLHYEGPWGVIRVCGETTGVEEFVLNRTRVIQVLNLEIVQRGNRLALRAVVRLWGRDKIALLSGPIWINE